MTTRRCSHAWKRKVAYPSKPVAENAARLRMLQKPGLSLCVYLCPICGDWHLTKKANSYGRVESAWGQRLVAE